MRIEVRVSSVEILPNDASGVRLIAEVCDASEFVESILRRPDDGADSWALGMRYQEVCDENRRLRAARQSAPETPTPRIEVLKRWLKCCFELKCDAMVLGPGDDDHYLASPTDQRYTDGPDVTAEELAALRAYAATLKERRERADD